MRPSSFRLPEIRAVLFGLGVALLTTLAAGTLLGHAQDPFMRGVFWAIHVLAFGLLVLRAATERRARGVAIGFAAAVGAWLAGWIHHAAVLEGLDRVPYPSLSDALWVLYYPAVFAGVASLVRNTLPRRHERRFWIDGLLLALLLSAVPVAIVLGPMRTLGSGYGALATNLAYPLGSVLLLVLAICGGGLRAWQPGRQMRVVQGTLLAQVVADVVWMTLHASGAYERGMLIDVVYPALALALAWAAWRPFDDAVPARPWNRLALPGCAAGLAVTFLAVAALHPMHPAAGTLAVLSLVGCGLRVGLILRGVEALRRDRDQALAAANSDHLTGLGNRRAFLTRLEEAVNCTRERHDQLTLVLFNLRRLRETNLMHGSEAGDERVRALAATLAGMTGPHGSAHRMEGESMALILPGIAEWEAFTAVQAIPDGDRVAIGLASLAPDLDGAGLVRRADAALAEARRTQRQVILWSPDVDPRPLTVDEAEVDRHNRTLATALARAVDAKDSYTRSHSETVAECCVMIGRQLRLPEERLAGLRLAGLLHDVGKIGIPDAILQKPAKLDAAEWEIMRSHSRLGADIVLGAELEQQAEWILHHHERVDGSGYPAGLAGVDIPLESRIIHVADAFEAMTADRPYRRGRPAAQALEELRRHAGTQFDPTCVDALCAVLGADDVVEAVPLPALAAA